MASTTSGMSLRLSGSREKVVSTFGFDALGLWDEQVHR